MHLHRIRLVIPLYVDMGNTLAKVRLEGVHARVQELRQEARVPLARGRVREVDARHAGLPFVPLPHVAVRALDEVSVLHAFWEDLCALA